MKTLLPVSQRYTKDYITGHMHNQAQILAHGVLKSGYSHAPSVLPLLCLAPPLPWVWPLACSPDGHHISGLPAAIFLLASISCVEDQPWPFNGVLAFLADMLVKCLSDDNDQSFWGLQYLRIPPVAPTVIPCLAQSMAPSPGTIASWCGWARWGHPDGM